jgi:uncharacterized protein YndB with AHSA1/START domain
VNEVQPLPGNSAEVTVTVIVNAPAARVYAAFTNWESQGKWIPFTTVRVTDGDGGVGSTIEAVTAIGPAALRDVMRVEKLDPPYQVQVLHTGKILKGPGIMRLTEMTGGRTQMVWHEWFQLPTGIAGRAAWPLLWPTSKVSLTQALKRFARMVESGDLP